MTFSSLIIVLFIFLLVGLVIVRPFLDPEMSLDSTGSSRYDSLLAEKERLYAAIEELDLNLELNKISKDEHSSGRNQLLAEAAVVLKKIEEHPFSARKSSKPSSSEPNDDDLERMIAERRQALKASRVDVCPSCGESTSPDDQFCSSCGERI